MFSRQFGSSEEKRKSRHIFCVKRFGRRPRFPTGARRLFVFFSALEFLEISFLVGNSGLTADFFKSCLFLGYFWLTHLGTGCTSQRQTWEREKLTNLGTKVFRVTLCFCSVPRPLSDVTKLVRTHFQLHMLSSHEPLTLRKFEASAFPKRR